MNDQAMELEYIVLADRKAVSDAAAQRFVALASQYTQTGQFTVALSGGSTPRQLFELLSSPSYRAQVAWPQIHLFWGDERCVPSDHADSNYRMTREALLDHIDIPPQNVHRIQGESTPQHAAEQYQAELERVLGADPRFDLVLLGMGSDGHTASLFPGSPALEERERTAIAVYAAHLDSWRVTLTLPILNHARHVLLLVSGSSKAPALSRIRAGEPLPAGRVRPSQGTLTWLLDRDAAIRK
jgi:6-phosphogluconolactonase